MEKTMTHYDYISIEERAHQLRAEEMQRIHGIVCERLGCGCTKLCTITLVVLTALSEAIRPFFSWNPRARSTRRSTGNFRAA
jgi:hypothetical protein